MIENSFGCTVDYFINIFIRVTRLDFYFVSVQKQSLANNPYQLIVVCKDWSLIPVYVLTLNVFGKIILVCHVTIGPVQSHIAN